MPKRLNIGTIIFPSSEEKIMELCESKKLIGYETEIIVRIYWHKQSLNYIADYMEFDKYGKPQKHYSVRSINNFHKEAFKKLLGNEYIEIWVYSNSGKDEFTICLYENIFFTEKAAKNKHKIAGILYAI